MLIAGILVASFAHPALAEEVTLSRSKFTIPQGSSHIQVPFSLDALCRDDDGCEVSLLIESGDSGIAAGSARLYLQQGGTGWSTTKAPGAMYKDGDSNENVAVDVVTGAGMLICELSDGDAVAPFNDASSGFSMLLINQVVGPSTCTLVVTD